MRRLASSSSLADVWVVAAQRLVAQDLQLHVKPLELGADLFRRWLLLALRAKAFRRTAT